MIEVKEGPNISEDEIKELNEKQNKVKENTLTLFIAQPMHGVDDFKINIERSEIYQYVKELYPNKDIELIDNLNHPEIPDGSPRYYYLVESLREMVRADLIYFHKDWIKAKGCRVERVICDEYPELKEKIISDEGNICK